MCIRDRPVVILVILGIRRSIQSQSVPVVLIFPIPLPHFSILPQCITKDRAVCHSACLSTVDCPSTKCSTMVVAWVIFIPVCSDIPLPMPMLPSSFQLGGRSTMQPCKNLNGWTHSRQWCDETKLSIVAILFVHQLSKEPYENVHNVHVQLFIFQIKSSFLYIMNPQTSCAVQLGQQTS